jgi:hypothetical protein
LSVLMLLPLSTLSIKRARLTLFLDRYHKS